MSESEQVLRRSEIGCARCGGIISPGDRREPTTGGAVHESCPDKPGVENLRRANRWLAECISNQHDLDDGRMWWRIESVLTAIRNGQRELDAPTEPGFCRACGCTGYYGHYHD